jgi:hypothetical protein
MITILTYYVEDSWSYLKVDIKTNNTYWIDWSDCEDIIEEKYFTTTDFRNFSIKNKNNNILSVCNGIYGYYNCCDCTFYEFNSNFGIICVANIDIKKRINTLNLEYDEKLFII